MVFKEIEGDIWNPTEIEDSIEGVLVSKNQSEKYKTNFEYILEVKYDSGIKTKTIFGTAMLNALMENVELGNLIKIVYKGTKPSKAGNDTKIFKVFVDK